jgi:hypothetical protein
MNHCLPAFVSAAIFCSGFFAAAYAQEPKAVTKDEKKEMRVLSTPRVRDVLIQRAEKGEVEKETVAFLGVETGPVSGALSAQLGLARGTGLVINHVLPKSPAVGVLQQHDILLKLDDQILIETRQLSVLIRNKQEGDEVTLTYVRSGKQATAKVKLGQQEVPKLALEHSPGAGAFAFSASPERFEFIPGEAGREEVDRVLSLLGRAPGHVSEGQRVFPRTPQIRVERFGGPGVRAMSINAQNSTIVYSDDAGSLELTLKDGVKTLTAKSAKGDRLFSGPVTTDEQRKTLPADLRERLEKLESMHGVTFETDGDFTGANVRVLRPRGISLPLAPVERARAPEPRRLPMFL